MPTKGGDALQNGERDGGEKAPFLVRGGERTSPRFLLKEKGIGEKGRRYPSIY